MKTTAQMRQLTVITRNRETGRVPEIRMGGRWLRESGFAPGSRLAIKVERCRLVVTVTASPRPLPKRRGEP